MSDPTISAALTTTEQVIDTISSVVSALAPLVAIADPAAAAGVALGAKIIQGVIAAEPTARALFEQITNGGTPSAADVATFAQQYEDAYQQLNADINAALAVHAPATN